LSMGDEETPYPPRPDAAWSGDSVQESVVPKSILRSSIRIGEYLSIGVTKRMAAVQCQRVYREDSGPIGSGLCRIWDSDFREFRFHDVRE